MSANVIANTAIIQHEASWRAVGSNSGSGSIAWGANHSAQLLRSASYGLLVVICIFSSVSLASPIAVWKFYGNLTSIRDINNDFIGVKTGDLFSVQYTFDTNLSTPHPTCCSNLRALSTDINENGGYEVTVEVNIGNHKLFFNEIYHALLALGEADSSHELSNILAYYITTDYYPGITTESWGITSWILSDKNLLQTPASFEQYNKRIYPTTKEGEDGFNMIDDVQGHVEELKGNITFACLTTAMERIDRVDAECPEPATIFLILMGLGSLYYQMTINKRHTKPTR